MFVVHVSRTPLAGSPIRIVRALNAHTNVSARLIDLAPQAYGARTFPEDLAWNDDRDEALRCIARADIVHFHHWFDFGSTDNPFGFDFLGALRPGARCLMQWHSHPRFVAKDSGCEERSILECALPQMVVAQYHERCYPRALPTPLIVEAPTAEQRVARAERSRPRVFFAPTRQVSAHAERWETKGAPEVRRVLRALEQRGLADVSDVRDEPFEECQRLRAQADIVVDDVATGSFHTTSLEALAEGKATIAYLDSRTQAVLAELTGSNDLPIVNVHLEQLQPVLEDLCRDVGLVRELGEFSAQWMREHYSSRAMVGHYVRGYERLLATGSLEDPRYAQHTRAKQWLYRDLPDRIWAARRRRVHPGAIIAALGRSTKGVRRHPALSALEQRLRRKGPAT